MSRPSATVLPSASDASKKGTWRGPVSVPDHRCPTPHQVALIRPRLHPHHPHRVHAPATVAAWPGWLERRPPILEQAKRHPEQQQYPRGIVITRRPQQPDSPPVTPLGDYSDPDTPPPVAFHPPPPPVNQRGHDVEPSRGRPGARTPAHSRRKSPPSAELCILHRTPDIDLNKQVLQRALVATVGGNRPLVSVDQVRDHICHCFGVLPDKFSVHLHQPEDFLLLFQNTPDMLRVLCDPTPASTAFRLIFKLWRRQSHASYYPLEHTVRLDISGIPAHLWLLSTAQTVVGSSCLITAMAPETESNADLTAFKVLATCTHPERMPTEKKIVVPEPGVSKGALLQRLCGRRAAHGGRLFSPAIGSLAAASARRERSTTGCRGRGS